MTLYGRGSCSARSGGGLRGRGRRRAAGAMRPEEKEEKKRRKTTGREGRKTIRYEVTFEFHYGKISLLQAGRWGGTGRGPPGAGEGETEGGRGERERNEDFFRNKLRNKIPAESPAPPPKGNCRSEPFRICLFFRCFFFSGHFPTGSSHQQISEHTQLN